MTNELLRLNVDIADSTGGFRRTEGERLHILLAGEGLERAQRVWSRLCSKEQSAEHD